MAKYTDKGRVPSTSRVVHHDTKGPSKPSKEDRKKEKIRKRRIELQKALSRTKDGKKVRDEKDIASGPKAAFPVKNRKKINRIKIKDD